MGRNRLIYARWLKGERLVEIAVSVGLSVSSVRRVCQRQQQLEEELRACMGDVAWALDWLEVWERAA
jgi:hypothetical protein